jgi:hypothetical protein
MGYLEVTRIHEALWIHWYGWQELNGLPRDKVLIQSGSISVELVDGEMMLYLTVVPLHEDGTCYWENGEPMMRSISVPYKEPIPEGVGQLVDWELAMPQKKTADDAA